MDGEPGERTRAISPTMRAARMGKRGGPELMRLEQVPPPELRPTDALVEVHAAAITHNPPRLSHSAAATLPLSGLTAWEGLVRYGKLASGKRVLIHGAAGGVGSFAVQLAQHFGAVVYATASARDLDFVRGLGAE